MKKLTILLALIAIATMSLKVKSPETEKVCQNPNWPYDSIRTDGMGGFDLINMEGVTPITEQQKNDLCAAWLR
jgi:hypothetical protein